VANFSEKKATKFVFLTFFISLLAWLGNFLDGFLTYKIEAVPTALTVDIFMIILFI